MRYVTRHRTGRVAGLAIVSGTTPFPMKTADNPGGIDRALMEADLEMRTRDRPRWFADNASNFFGVGLPGVDVSPEFAQFMIRECLTCSAHATRTFFMTGFASDMREDLRRITLPTLVVHGDRDAQAPLSICGARTARLLPQGTLCVYENAAHGLFVTHADRLNRDLHAFLRASVGRS